MRSVLLAELDIRFQPVEGLLAALRTLIRTLCPDTSSIWSFFLWAWPAGWIGAGYRLEPIGARRHAADRPVLHGGRLRGCTATAAPPAGCARRWPGWRPRPPRWPAGSTPAAQPAPRRPAAHRRRARAALPGLAHALPGRPAGLAGHARHLPGYGGHCGAPAGAGKRHRPARHPRLAGRAPVIRPGLRLRHLDRRRVATSAMLGLLSALCRRDRILASQQFDARVATTTLRPYSQSYQREETLAAAAPGRRHAGPGRTPEP